MFCKKIHEIGKGFKHFMNERLDAYRAILASAQNRLILGLLMLGLGAGLVASAFIRVPA